MILSKQPDTYIEPESEEEQQYIAHDVDVETREEKEILQEIHENSANLELLPLALKTVYDFKFLLEHFKTIHPTYLQLQEQYDSMIPVLQINALHYTVILEFITNLKEKKLADILKDDIYAPIRNQYNLGLKDVVISSVVLEQSLKYIIRKLYVELYKILHDLNTPSLILVNANDAAWDIQIIRSKLETVVAYLPKIIQSQRSDLLTLPRTHPRWAALIPYVSHLQTAPKDKIIRDYDLLYRVLNVASATIHRAHREKALLKDCIHVVGPMYYWLAQGKANRIAKYTISNAKPEDVLQLWGLPDHEIIRNSWKIVYPKISTNLRIHVPRCLPELTKEQLLKEVHDNVATQIDPMQCVSMQQRSTQQKMKELEELKMNSASKVPIRILCHKKYDPFKLLKQAPKTSEAQAKIHKKLNALEETKQKEADSQSSESGKKNGNWCFKRFKNWNRPLNNSQNIQLENFNPGVEFKELIIHIHGGGFVSMSSGSHQNYTRRWAKMLKCPIFSIDYRLAPENPFSAAIDDCWQFYNWILAFGKDLLGIAPEKIILAGDSAGGNLCIVLALKAIKSGIRVPDGILAVYPALCLDPNQFSPSLLNAMEETMLSYSFLKLCLNAYIPENYNYDNNFYLSPICAPNDLLAKLPPIRMIVGENDPLYDDTWRFLERLVNLKKDVKLRIYKYLPHAFLSYDQTTGYKVIIKDTVELLSELLKRQKVSK